LAAAWAAARPTIVRFGLYGLAVAFAVNAKPYGILLTAGVLPLLLPLLQAFSLRQRLRKCAAFAAPVAVGIAAAAWYNWYRTRSLTNFGNPYSSDLVGTPINVLGLLFSPGKGLIFYSPLVILGALGIKDLWRVDRPLAITILTVLGLNTLVIAASGQWGDETWGPRYLAPSAWLLVLPIAWWVTSRFRRRILIAVATLAVYIQLAAVFPYYGVSTLEAQLYSGTAVYSRVVPYGQDGPRWIAPVTPLLFQSELLAAWIKEKLTGTGFVVSYHPYLGTPATIDLTHPGTFTGRVQLVVGAGGTPASAQFGGSEYPDFWWEYPGHTAKEKALAALLGLLTLLSGGLLTWRFVPLQRRPQRQMTAIEPPHLPPSGG
jgi:hypothetical protein